MEQTPLRQVLHLSAPTEKGKYSIQLPPSVCFGSVCSGGLVMSIAARAAHEYVSQEPRMKTHPDVLHFAARFFRPMFAAPRTVDLHLRSVESTNSLTTLHVDIMQNGKLCFAGYVTLTDLSVSAHMSASTGWRLIPPPAVTTIETLERDDSMDWVSYLSPFSPTSFNNPQSYMHYYLPVRGQEGRHTIDQWVTPGWADPDHADGAVWTDELVHFVVDNCLPLLNDIIVAQGKSTLYELVLAAGREQRKSRQAGINERIKGKGMTQDNMVPWIISTISVTTEVKKLLRRGGERWLFMRATAKSLNNGRMDTEIILLDAGNNLVALSNQVAQVIPTASKADKKLKRGSL